MTIISATLLKALKRKTGMKSWITTRAARPTSGASRKVVRLAAAGMMVSLPQSLKKS